MKSFLSLALAGVLLSAVAAAGNFTEDNIDKAKAIIDAAIAAHGGEALTSDLKTLQVESETTNFAVDQSRGTEAPWDTNESEGFNAIDLERSIFVTRNKGAGGGFENHAATIINGDDSAQVDFRAGTISTIAEPDFDTTSGPFVRVTPALLLRTLKNREANAHFLGVTTVDDVDYNVVGFSMTVGPAISLYFEKSTNLLRRSERVFPGFGLVEYRFNDYVTRGGVPYNEKFELYLNGDLNMQRDNVAVRVNEPLEDALKIPATLARLPELQPDPLTRLQVSEGVWLAGGNGTYAMFVDMGDYLFAAGGAAGIPERIELVREVAGDKPLRYGMLTHHHSDHVLGVTAYESEGATVIAAAAHERIARRAANNGELLKLKAVDKKMTLEAQDRRIEIIDIGPTAHTEHLLVAWLPEEGILFEADHFAMPRVGPVPPAVTSTRTFAAAVARAGLDVRTYLSAHSPKPGTPEDLAAALSRDALQARQ